MKNLKIKVCGMREPENIKAVCELKPDFIGLIFYPKSKRFVPDKAAKDIIACIPSSIRKIGVFVNELMPEIVHKINLFGLDYVQLHGNESVDYCAELKSIDIKVIKSFGIDESFDLRDVEPYSSFCDYFLFDTKSNEYGGTGLKFNWSIINKYQNSTPLILSGGIGPDDAPVLPLSNPNVKIIDINSKFETKPALKDIQLLKEFITKIRNI